MQLEIKTYKLYTLHNRKIKLIKRELGTQHRQMLAIIRKKLRKQMKKIKCCYQINF